MADYPPNPVVDPPMGGDLSGLASAAQIVAGAVTDVEVAAANKDGGAGVASMRTLGGGAQQAVAGNDARLSDARTPTGHHASHEPGGGDAMAVDAAAGVGSLRTIGAGALQATAGNDARLSNKRVPVDGTVDKGALLWDAGSSSWVNSKIAAANITAGTITNTEVSNSAAIAESKLALTSGISKPYTNDDGVITSGNAIATNGVRGIRFTVPATGTWLGITVYLTATSGNIVAGVFDTTVTNLAVLASTGVVAAGTLNTWQTGLDWTTPLAVVRGQVVFVALHTDNATVAFGRTGASSNNAIAGPLPAGYITDADATNLLIWNWTRGSFSAPLTAAPTVSLTASGGGFKFYMKYA